MRSEFRLFAFETGKQYYAQGTLDNIRLSTVFKAFEKKVAPNKVPPSLKSDITVEIWKKAVRANDINMLARNLDRPDVQKVHTIKEKLQLPAGVEKIAAARGRARAAARGRRVE